MPELPEIKVYAENLNKLVGQKTIDDLREYAPFSLEKLIGRTVEKVTSFGKGIYFELKGGGNFYVHLMLGGFFAFVSKEEYALIKNKLAAFRFQEKYLVVSDMQRLAKVERNFIRPSVPEAGGENFTVGYFLSLFDTASSIKNLLLNQSLIVGIGNAYADEILYKAGISPFSAANKIPEKERKVLYSAICDCLSEAVCWLKKYYPDMISGEFREFFKVHKKGFSETESHEKILVKQSSGKKTYYVAEQKLY